MGNIDYSLEEALKVLKVIENIQMEAEKGSTGELRKVELSESQLNSYIAYRIETEKQDIMKQLKLKLFKDNKIEGEALIDLREQDIPDYLKPRMTILFGAKVEVNEGKVRVNMKDIFLEYQRIKPYVVDLIILIASRIEKTEPWSIKDWYELPYGIKDIKTTHQKLIAYY